MSLPGDRDGAIRFEMRHRVTLQAPRPFRTGMLVRLREPTVSFYRYLLETVGRGRLWAPRRRASDEEIAAEISDDAVNVTVLYLGGVPAGFFEVDARRGSEVRVERVGIVPEFEGRGLAKYLLAAAVDAAWDLDPDVVAAETSHLDDPRSLLLLQWAGFSPVGSGANPNAEPPRTDG